MIYIYIVLRYLRQLNRICPEVPAQFFEAAEASARKNGGASCKLTNGFLYSFDTRVVGNVFASARCIGDLVALLEQHKDRIREYFVLVDYLEKPVTTDAFVEGLSVYDTVIFPDKGLFITKPALSSLDEFIRTEPLEKTQLALCTGLRYPDQKKAAERHGKKPVAPMLYTDYAFDPVMSLRNLACIFPDLPIPQDFTPEDTALFTEGKKALAVYARFRFSLGQPEYRIAACLDYFALLFRAYNATIPAAPKTPRIKVCGSVSLGSEWNPVLERLSSSCRFSALEAPGFSDGSIDDLPSDLSDFAWLLYRSVNLLFLDELPQFFRSLGKETEYVQALGGWLYSAGIVADPANLRSLNPALEDRIAAKTGSRKAGLDLKLAAFLWTLYEKGKIEPVFPFYEVLKSLGFEVPDSFLVNCLYHENNPLTALEPIRSSFLDPELADTVANLEKARALYEHGEFDEATAIGKGVLHAFQKEKILTGEYRALSLIALLSLARKKGDDAVVYFEYALENAELLHDPYSELSTRFDMAMVYFVIGNLHFALCTLDMAENLVEECYAKDREVLLLFMKGRVSFELGDYRNSELYFQTAASLASVHQIPESVTLCRVWYARALVHQNRFASAENILAECVASVPDAWLFLLESSLVSGRAISGIKFPESLEEGDDESVHWPLSSVTWKSGFSVAEDRSYGLERDSRIAVRMYRAFYLYYCGRYHRGENNAEIVAELSQIAKVALEREDPYASMYYFFCFDLGSKSSDIPPADIAGFLSRGFKYMQRRANEIGDNAMREQFMQSPTWNSRLYRVARDNMLI